MYGKIGTKYPIWIMLIGAILLFTYYTFRPNQYTHPYEAQVDSVLSQMTLVEKIGQLNHLKGNYSTDIYEQDTDLEEEIQQGRVGALTPFVDLDQLIAWQKLAVEESRLGIPLLYAADVVHGYRTIFPVPLAQAASWDLKAIEQADRIAATEMSAAGLHWTFAPMVDISRDPRWGRVMEGAGEDPYLGSCIAEARVRGFQGDDLLQSNTVIACAKHFAAYGAPEGGMEYNTVDVSERRLRELHLPPFRASVDAGVATLMNSFNVVAGVPASSNDLLLKQILRKEWEFTGFTVSDANSLHEVIPHGVAANRKEAAYQCFTAGSDTDLWGQVYVESLEELVKEGAISEVDIDRSVRRILRYKFELGLFDDPYRYFDTVRLQQTLRRPEHLEAARSLARKSFVLLKNDNQLLPFQPAQYERIALIGPLGNSREYKDLIGNWSGFANPDDLTTVYQGLKEALDTTVKLDTASGCRAFGNCPEAMIEQARRVAERSDVVVLAVGENGYNTGECASRADISLPGNQEELIKVVAATGKPIVLLLFTGRPLELTDILNDVSAIMVCWQPGTEAGLAVADVLLGDHAPQGKLPMTFPYHQGQIPIYYSHLNTGRPRQGPEDTRWGVSKWSDVPNEPLFPFGYGLSYTTFSYSPPTLSQTQLSADDTLKIYTTVTNTGQTDGTEVAQLYIRDQIATVSRPVKELRGFQLVTLAPGASQSVTFQMTVEDLKYWTREMQYAVEPGNFSIFVGGNSQDTQTVSFSLMDDQ
ncbi:beta-glucosidase BglX [Tunicatimonas pelagia]|uniref:beta-glucosidase BglX n=1 Tax=Tunicatimonas pelagia TaxID=931531 RepID=UPI002665C561|nr:beta-glucosidase BglX [Tunicatimonas pelagia]WKN44205.1 beta-glucosidase BglX [Tunicatimonas pelagia]